MYGFLKIIAGWLVHVLRTSTGESVVAAGIIVAIIASSAPLSPASQAAEHADAIANFSGNWQRPFPPEGAAKWPLRLIFYPPDKGPGPVVFNAEAGKIRQGMPYMGDDTNPILLPHAAATVRAQRDMYREGEAVWSAFALCWPVGVPLAFSMVNAVQFLQADDQVTIIYQRGQTVRHIYLNEAHPRDLASTWFGHSVGHYEEPNTLVIDTISQNPRALIDRFGTPKSDAMRITERYTISDDGQLLDVKFNVEDPKTFTTAWSAKVSYVRIPQRSGDAAQAPIFEEVICSENNRDAGGGTYPIPVATTADF
jgi:hypothetical protein